MDIDYYQKGTFNKKHKMDFDFEARPRTVGTRSHQERMIVDNLYHQGPTPTKRTSTATYRRRSKR